VGIRQAFPRISSRMLAERRRSYRPEKAHGEKNDELKR
jgi:hypothetical protein